MSTNSHVDGIERCAQSLHLRSANVHARLHFDISHTQNGANIFVQALARKTIRGNAVAHHAAQLRFFFEHRNAMTHERQIIRAGQTAGTRTHNGNSAPRVNAARGNFHRIGRHLIHGELLDAANVKGRIDQRATTA